MNGCKRMDLHDGILRQIFLQCSSKWGLRFEYPSTPSCPTYFLLDPERLLLGLHLGVQRGLQHSGHLYYFHTGCLLNILFFEDIKTYSGLWPISVSPRCQCVYTMAGQAPVALQQNCRVKKNHNILRKNAIFNDHPVYKTTQAHM